MPEYVVLGFKMVVDLTDDQKLKDRLMHRLETSVLDRTRVAYRAAVESLLTQEEMNFAHAFLTSEVGKKYLFRMHADIPLDGSKPKAASEGRLSKKFQAEADAFLSSGVGQVVFLISPESKSLVNQAAKEAYLDAVTMSFHPSGCGLTVSRLHADA